MSLITVDFETFYSDDFTLTKLTTEEYIRDSRFETIGVGIKVDDNPTRWITGTHEEVAAELLKYDWANSCLLCHNTLFDGAILAWRYGIVPYMYLDTLSMARAVHGVNAGGSLSALAERYGLGVKGTEVVNAKNKNRCQFSYLELEAYGKYCVNDVNLTLDLFVVLSREFPDNEMGLIDLTLRMFITPLLSLDTSLLQVKLIELKLEKSNLLKSLMGTLGCETEEEVRKKLASNKQFANVLTSMGVNPPLKISKITGKETYALAKNDTAFMELAGHEDVIIQQLCSVRLGTKSTLEESRIERFIDIGKRNDGKLPIPLKYYGAHTGRWSGSDKVNLQNLPSRDKKKKALKNAILAPEGHLLINCDSSQIEARVLAWLAGQNDLVDAFANKQDVYCEFASKVYYRLITKDNPIERFVGKTCILGLGYGTGALKLQHTLKTTPPYADIPLDRCEEIVKIYRANNNKIIELWREGDSVIKTMANWDNEYKPFPYGNNEVLWVHDNGIKLPNGLFINYPNLGLTGERNNAYEYKSRKGPVSLWGGSVVENVVQALARIVIGEQMLLIKNNYPIALTVHDAVVCIVKEDEIDKAMQSIVEVMSTPPDWAKTLPIACEAKYGKTYGDC